MSRMLKRSWIAIACLLVGIFGGAAGAQVVESALRARYLNSGLFALAAGDTAYFHVTLDDLHSGQPARVRLQFLDETGWVAASDDADVRAGQSTTLRVSGPGLFRAHAEVLDPSLKLTARRTVVGAVEMFDLAAEKKPPVCTIFDIPNAGGGGRQ